jgi:hypothetical protein
MALPHSGERHLIRAPALRLPAGFALERGTPRDNG